MKKRKRSGRKYRGGKTSLSLRKKKAYAGRDVGSPGKGGDTYCMQESKAASSVREEGRRVENAELEKKT